MTAHGPYDALIVGAGPAGCVLANRLTEDPSKRVLLIEAGPDVTRPGSELPDIVDPFCLSASNNSLLHWPGLTASLGPADESGASSTEVPFLQAWGVGGASNVNGMGVDRAHPEDFEEWNALGVTGWTWDQVLPYFRKLETDLDFGQPAGRSELHGNSGPMPVRRLPRSAWAPFAAAVASACERRGYPFVDDYTGDLREGFSAAPTNSLPDRRVSAAMAYLNQEVRNRPNLQILSSARVDRVNLDRRCVQGVDVHSDTGARRITARQVILACGALQSPVVLMHSGIGPAARLSALGIDVVRDVPAVGANLQNHPCVTLTTYLSRKAVQATNNPSFLQQWLRYSSNHRRAPPRDMHIMPFNTCAWHALGRRVGAITVSVMKSYSAGSVQLSSADPAARPRIAFNLLADPCDLERLIDGTRLTLALLSDPAVALLHHEVFVPNGQLIATLNPRTGWNRFRAAALVSLLNSRPLRSLLLTHSRIDTERLLSDERALREFVQRSVQPQYHVCGTCRMGRDEDPKAVVDSVGRVKGLHGLRIVEASIFPTIPRAYTHFVVLMAAEKLSDAIKSEWHSEDSVPQATGTG
jgi:5-(hydroxymethyl)furfural/furfural oxidase